MRSNNLSRRGVLANAWAVVTAVLCPGLASRAAAQQPTSKGLKPTKANIEEEAKKQQKNLTTIPMNVEFTMMRICCGSPIPAGWIKVNDAWGPTSCGDPTEIVYNICIILKYSNLGIGASLNVCYDAPTPSGWVDVNKGWNPTACGYPTEIVDNIKQIKRAS